MSGLISRIGLDILSEDGVDFYIIPNLVNLPPTYDVRGTVHLEPNSPIISQTNSPGTPGEITYYSSHPGVLAPSTTYWVQFDILDTANGNAIVASGGRWITTAPDGSYETSGNAYNSCGDPQEANVPRHSWKGAKSPTVKGGEVA